MKPIPFPMGWEGTSRLIAGVCMKYMNDQVAN